MILKFIKSSSLSRSVLHFVISSNTTQNKTLSSSVHKTDYKVRGRQLTFWPMRKDTLFDVGHRCSRWILVGSYIRSII